jgi:hypothetical protein
LRRATLDATYIDSSDTGANFGGRGYLYLKDDSQRDIWLRFRAVDFQPAIPAGSTWNSVTLKMRWDDAQTDQGALLNGAVNIRISSDDTWTEGSLTWGSRPTAVGAVAGTFGVGGSSRGSSMWNYPVDLGMVYGQLGGFSDDLLSLMIEGGSNGAVGRAYMEKESTQYRPRLEVDFTPPPATTGTTGRTTGATTGVPTTGVPSSVTTTGTPPTTTGTPPTTNRSPDHNWNSDDYWVPKPGNGRCRHLIGVKLRRLGPLAPLPDPDCRCRPSPVRRRRRGCVRVETPPTDHGRLG